MQLTPSGKARERIMLVGGAGAGKTHAWFTIANNTDGHFYVLDSDIAAQRFLDSEQFAHLEPRLSIVEPSQWQDYIGSVKKWAAVADRDSWLVVDLYGKAWDEVQANFTQEVYGEELGEFWMRYRKQLQAADGRGSKNPFDVTIDWQPIKANWKSWTTQIIRWPGHVLVACAAKSLNEQYDGADLLARYRQFGAKPDADKAADHLFHTVMWMKGNTAETRRMFSVKDRQRELVSGVPPGDFSLSYLARLGGWRPA